MAYIYDPDLEFLADIDNEEIKALIDILTRGKDGELRWTEGLSATAEYQKYYPDNCHKMWEKAAEHLQRFGGNSVANSLRGCGVKYREILQDVCGRMHVKFDEEQKIDLIEKKLIEKTVKAAVEKMSTEDRKELAEKLGKEVGASVSQKFLGGALVTADILIACLNIGGIQAYYVSNLIIQSVLMHTIGHGVFTGAAMHWLSVFAGPIGWALSGVLTVGLFAGPAYRVTVPAVLVIACLRIKQSELPWSGKLFLFFSHLPRRIFYRVRGCFGD